MDKKDVLIVSIIIFIAVCFRVYKLNAPLADKYSAQQANYASIARYYARGEFNLLKPQTNNLSDSNNPMGYRFAEAPLYSAIFGALHRYLPIPSISLAMYGRITTIFFSLIIIYALYYLARKEHSRTAAIFVSIMYAIFPFFVFYSRIVLTETMSLAFLMLAIISLYTYSYNKKSNYVIYSFSILFFAIALLVNPYISLLTIPLIYLFVIKYKFDIFKRMDLYLYFILGTLPFIAWRIYALQYSPGIVESTSLLTDIQTSEGLENIYFQPIFFKSIFMDVLGIGIFGIYLTGLFIVGISSKFKRNIHMVMAGAGILYIIILQGINIQYSYHLALILPAIALATGIGIDTMVSHNKVFNKVILYPSIAVILVLSFYFSYTKVITYYNYPSDLTQIAKLITTFTNESDKIVTDTNGDTTLLYLSDRKGSPVLFTDVPGLQKEGYSYLITDKKNLTEELKEQGLVILVENQRFSIIKL